MPFGIETNTDHVSGPWDFALVADPHTKPLQGYRITDATGVVVAEIFARPYPVAVTEKNARLIAAAPDMLAALRLCESVLGRLSLHHPGALNAFNAAFDAIAKAEGSTNA